MYKVSDKYKELRYSEDNDNKLYLEYDGTIVENAPLLAQNLKWSRRVIDNGSKVLKLDNFVSQTIELKINDFIVEDTSKEFYIKIGSKVDEEYEYVPLGYYHIKVNPSTANDKTTYSLIDRSTFFDKYIDISPLIEQNGGKITKRQAVQEYCRQCGVELATPNFMGADDEIGIYDNTITARIHLSYIGECAGCWTTIGRDGKLHFIPLVKPNDDNSHIIPERILNNKMNNSKSTFKVSKVVFEGALMPFEKGNDTGDTLFINSSNPYISKQDDIDRIYEQVVGLEIDNINTSSIIGDPSIDPWDYIEYTHTDDEGNTKENFTSLGQYNLEFNGVFKQTFDTSIDRETKKINSSVHSDSTKIKRLKQEVDLVNASLKITAEQVGENSSKIGELELSSEGFRTSITNLSTKTNKIETDLGTTNNNVSKLQSDLNGVSADFDDFKDNEYVNSIKNLQNQIDGAIQFWNGSSIPTLNNYPANEWTTENERINHQADIYTVIQDIDGELKQGKSYRFDKVNGVWQWIELTDNELSAVQQIAQNALDKANKNEADVDVLTKKTTELSQTDSEIKASINTLNNQYQTTIKTQQEIKGNPIYFEDGGEYPLERQVVYGKSEQKTTQGLQLGNFEAMVSATNTTIEKIKNTYTLNGNGESSYQHISVPFWKNFKNKIKSGMKLSFNCKSASVTNQNCISIVQFVISFKDGTANEYHVLYNFRTGNKRAYIIPDNTDNIANIYVGLYTDNRPTNLVEANILVVEEPMLYIGNVDNPPDFEEYTGGIQSPNPLFPQKIETIKGTLTAKITDKNMYDYVTPNIQNISIKAQRNSDGSFTFKGTPSYDYQSFILSKDYTDKLIDGETYTISQNIPAYVYLQVSANPIDGISPRLYITSSNSPTRTSNTFTVDKSKYKYTANVMHGRIADVGENVDLTLFFQLEKGDKATGFEPYKDNISEFDLESYELNEVGDVRDEVNLITGILTKRIGKIQFDGSESGWYMEKNEKAPYIRFVSGQIPETKDEIIRRTIKSDYFYFLNSGHISGGAFLYGKKIFIYLPEEIDSLVKCKSWLEEHKPTFYYLLEELEIIQLTPKQIKTFKGINNASVSANLVPEAEWTYLTDSSLNGQYATKTELKLTEGSIKSELNKKVSTDNFNTTIEEINNSIEQKITDSEASTESKISVAKTEAINSANTNTTNQLKNYSNTSDMNTAINNAKDEAINSSNSATDEKLKSYSTTTQMNNAITQKITQAENSIKSEVSNTYSTKTETNEAINNIQIGGRNLIKYSKGDKKEGFFKNFSKVENGYGEHTFTSKKNYIGLSLIGAYVIDPYDYEEGKDVTMSFDIMFTDWDIPDGAVIGEWWVGQRYGESPWSNIAQFTMPKVGVNGCELNKWFHFTKTTKIPKYVYNTDGSHKKTQQQFSFYNSNADVTASITFRMKNVKLEYGNKATDWTPAPEDVENEIKEVNTNMTNLIEQKITESENSIKLEVSNTYETKEEVKAQLDLKVGKDENNQIVSMLNASADEITLEGGSKIHLQSSGSLIIDSGNLKLDSNGNISLTGEINSASGKIGGFEILEKRLRATNQKVGISSSTYEGDPVIWAGVGDPYETDNWTTEIPFYVTNNGYFKASSGRIGGWYINNDRIYSDVGSRYAIGLISNLGSPNPTDACFHVWDSQLNTNTFFILNNGYLHCSSCDISGTINSGSGKVGGLTINGTNGLKTDYFSVTPNGQLNLFPQVGAGGVYLFNNGMRLNASAGMAIASSSDGNRTAPSSGGIDIMACSGTELYLACKRGSNASGTGSSITLKNGEITLYSAGPIYSNKSISVQSSTRATKKNIKKLSQRKKDELCDLIKNIPAISFDYKEKYGDTGYYGFLIDDIENTKLNDLLHIKQMKFDKNIKCYSNEDLTRLELIVIQELMKKIEKLERKLSNG